MLYDFDKSFTFDHSFTFHQGTFCGVFRRQALDRGAMLVGANKIVTGK